MQLIIDVYNDVWLVARRNAGLLARVCFLLLPPIVLALVMGSAVGFEQVVGINSVLEAEPEDIALSILRVTIIYGPMSLVIAGAVIAIMVATAVAGWQTLHGRQGSLRGILIGTHDHRWRVLWTAFLVLLLPWMATVAGVVSQFYRALERGQSGLSGADLFEVTYFAAPVLLYSFLITNGLLARVVMPTGFQGVSKRAPVLLSLANLAFFLVLSFDVLWLISQLWGVNLSSPLALLARPSAVVLLAVAIAPARALVFVCSLKRRHEVLLEASLESFPSNMLGE